MTLEKFENEETLELEMEKIKKIDHQNFSRFYEAKILPINKPFLLLEYIPVMFILFFSFLIKFKLIYLFLQDETLKEIINKHYKDREMIEDLKITLWLLQIAHALSYLHSLKLIHQNLNPS